MVWHYQATIVNIQLTSLAANCLSAFGAIKNPVVKQEVINKIREDLIVIMQGVVDSAIKYFGKRSGRMEASLKRGIQVTGRTPVSLRAILHGVDYTLMHEYDTILEPRNSEMIAIPLKAACRADGTPKLVGGPTLWEGYKNTFVISGNKAARAGRVQRPSEINPHDTDDICYIAYRDNSRGHEHLVYLYKLVPYSIFKRGKKNYKGKALKKLGLRNRLKAAISSAWAGWFDFIVAKLMEAKELQALEVYKGVHINKSWAASTNTFNIPKGAVNNIADKAAGIVNTVIEVNRG